MQITLKISENSPGQPLPECRLMCQWHDWVRLTPPFFSIANCRQVSERSWEWVPLPRLPSRLLEMCPLALWKFENVVARFLCEYLLSVMRSLGLLVCRAVKLSVFHSLTPNTHSISKQRKQAALLSLFMNTANFWFQKHLPKIRELLLKKKHKSNTRPSLNIFTDTCH